MTRDAFAKAVNLLIDLSYEYEGRVRPDPDLRSRLDNAHYAVLAEWDRLNLFCLKLADRIGASSEVLGRAAERAVQPGVLKGLLDTYGEAMHTNGSMWEAPPPEEPEKSRREAEAAKDALLSYCLKNHKTLTLTKRENDDAV